MILKIAGHVFRIQNIYKYVEEYCKAYLITDKSCREEFCIKIDEADIEFERAKSEAEDKKEGIPIRYFSDEYLETLAVYRKLSCEMLKYNTILFHGSVVAVDGQGYLFTAKSGTGKSTHTKLWREYFGDRAVMVNDDKPLLTMDHDTIMVYGTPWDGKHRLSTNISVPLKAICVLERGETNLIKKVDRKKVYPMILQQTNRPAGIENMQKTMQLLDKLLDLVPVYKLKCNMDIEACRVAYEGMNM